MLRQPAPGDAALQAQLAAAVARHRSGDLAGAEPLYRRVLRRAPDHVEVQHLLGLVEAARGRPAAGERRIRAALARSPDRAEHWSNLGNVLQRAGRLDEAVEAFRQALRRDDSLADAHANLAGALLAAEQLEAAEMAARRALRLMPDHPVALANLGGSLVGQARYREASEPLERARELGRDSPALWRNIGHLRLALDDAAAAETAFRQALRLDAGDLEATKGLGFALVKRRALSEAEPLLQHYVARRPTPSQAQFVLGHLRFLAGRQEEGLGPLRLGADRPGAGPSDASTGLFDLNYVPGLAPEALLAAHRRWSDRFAAGPAPDAASFANEREPMRRLRVGLVSPDFRAHSVSFFLRPLLDGLDGDAVETYAYADLARPDGVTERLRRSVTHWRDVWRMSDAALVDLVRGDRIDLLIDLAGHTADNRLTAFGRRAAPVQVAYLGYPATTGLATMDARIVDGTTDPEGAEAHASERLCRLGRCFLAYGPDLYPEVAPPPSLARGAISFGSFNNMAKLNPEVVATWAAVLRAVPGSRLVLKHDVSHDAGVQAHLAGLFATHGVTRQWLVFLERTPDLLSHLAAYAEIDIALDPFPYNGTTTTCESLWMGVPVVTLAGTHHAGRVGASLLSAAGLEAWVARDVDDYVRTARELAGSPRLLSALRSLLRPELAGSALCDGRAMGRAFEQALRELWGEWCATGTIARVGQG
jgi:predicted O-linked N-acetylglucosamine transferase (SPINDLY family)